MPISGLVITLGQSPALAERARAAIEDDNRFELGPREGRRLAAIVETQSQEEDRRAWKWLNAVPGVEFVDLVYAQFADASGPEAIQAGDITMNDSSMVEAER